MKGIPFNITKPLPKKIRQSFLAYNNVQLLSDFVSKMFSNKISSKDQDHGLCCYFFIVEEENRSH
jgi:hypothetical protein